MAKKILTEEVEKQLREEQLPYDYDTKEYPIEVIFHKYEKGLLYVPNYQRKFVWDIKQKSRFIESILLGVPIMPFFVSIVPEEIGKLEIIDGSQRIRTIHSFLKNEFALSTLTRLHTLNRAKYKDLPSWVQSRFNLIDIRFHVVTEKADMSIRADIFDRINTSGRKLTESEVRKGAFQGEFYDFIVKCSKDDHFRKLCSISTKLADRGEYEELVCRFFAYSEKYQESKHAVAGFLNMYIQDKIKNGFDEQEMTNKFHNMLNFVELNFAPNFFSKSKNVSPRVRFEAIAVGVHLALSIKPDLKISDIDWIDSKEFKEVTTTDASNNPGRLVRRVEFVRDKLLENIDL